jgi:hypothetical protein
MGNLNINAVYTVEINSYSLTDTVTSATRSTEEMWTESMETKFISMSYLRESTKIKAMLRLQC